MLNIPLYLKQLALPTDSPFLQLNSAAQSYPTPCNAMDCSMPGLPVHHQPPDLAQTHVHLVHSAIQPSHPLSSPFSFLQSFPASGSFQMSQFFASVGRSIRGSALTSVLLMNFQDLFPLGLDGLLSLQSNGL